MRSTGPHNQVRETDGDYPQSILKPARLNLDNLSEDESSDGSGPFVLSPWLMTLLCARFPPSTRRSSIPFFVSIGPSLHLTLTLNLRNLAQRQNGNTYGPHRRWRTVFRKHAPDPASKILVVKELLDAQNLSITVTSSRSAKS
ncbi:hypothetical protein B0H17DRAFT_1201111 [Mycena rosella]|uniref:Uncharacterized protein n=1 Tax=Mycena rosella TaxID=1033263 RepID=A0AAD7DHE5_MYCRO|nr:hypothetical protein B0H17DRAFT_1201111 [Mycena rosella]